MLFVFDIFVWRRRKKKHMKQEKKVLNLHHTDVGQNIKHEGINGRLSSVFWVALEVKTLAQTSSEWLSNDKNVFWSHNGKPS